jgi:tetratricopeptide (TPR) repeat protein
MPASREERMRGGTVKLWLRNVTIFLAVVTSISSSLWSQTTARDEQKLGVQACRQSKFDEAIQHFETCVAMDPANSVAHFYLATSYAQQYIPGVETLENVLFAEQAVDQYQHVLDSDPPALARTNGTKGIAYMDLQMKKFNDSKKYYRMGQT